MNKMERKEKAAKKTKVPQLVFWIRTGVIKPMMKLLTCTMYVRFLPAFLGGGNEGFTQFLEKERKITKQTNKNIKI